MKKKYILSALAEMILMMVACLFSSSQLNTLILSFAFDFVFLKYFYNPYMISDKERIKKEIKEYNQKKMPS